MWHLLGPMIQASQSSSFTRAQRGVWRFVSYTETLDIPEPKKPKLSTDTAEFFNFSCPSGDSDSFIQSQISEVEIEVNVYRVYKTLAKLAQKLLCIQATSVPSERLFSTAGNTVFNMTASFNPSTVDWLIFLNKNLTKK